LLFISKLIFMELIVTTKEELKSTLKSVLQEYEKEKDDKKNVKLLSINQVAKILGRSHATIKKAAMQGLLHTSIDGRVPMWSVEEFLRQEKNDKK